MISDGTRIESLMKKRTELFMADICSSTVSNQMQIFLYIFFIILYFKVIQYLNMHWLCSKEIQIDTKLHSSKMSLLVFLT